MARSIHTKSFTSFSIESILRDDAGRKRSCGSPSACTQSAGYSDLLHLHTARTELAALPSGHHLHANYPLFTPTRYNDYRDVRQSTPVLREPLSEQASEPLCEPLKGTVREHVTGLLNTSASASPSFRGPLYEHQDMPVTVHPEDYSKAYQPTLDTVLTARHHSVSPLQAAVPTCSPALPPTEHTHESDYHESRPTSTCRTKHLGLHSTHRSTPPATDLDYDIISERSFVSSSPDATEDDELETSASCRPNVKGNKKSRTSFTPQQINSLEGAYIGRRYIPVGERKQLARRLHLSDQQVKTWFQNRRMKEKRQSIGACLMPSAGMMPFIPSLPVTSYPGIQALPQGMPDRIASPISGHFEFPSGVNFSAFAGGQPQYPHLGLEAPVSPSFDHRLNYPNAAPPSEQYLPGSERLGSARSGRGMPVHL